MHRWLCIHLARTGLVSQVRTWKHTFPCPDRPCDNAAASRDGALVETGVGLLMMLSERSASSRLSPPAAIDEFHERGWRARHGQNLCQRLFHSRVWCSLLTQKLKWAWQEERQSGTKARKLPAVRVAALAGQAYAHVGFALPTPCCCLSLNQGLSMPASYSQSDAGTPNGLPKHQTADPAQPQQPFRRGLRVARGKGVCSTPAAAAGQCYNAAKRQDTQQ